MKRLVGIGCALMLAASLMSGGSAGAAASTSPYVVMVRNTADPVAVAASVGATPDFVYRSAIKGFAAALTSSQRNQLGKSSAVVSVVPDDTIGLPDTETPVATIAPPAQQVPPGVQRIGGLASPTAAIDGIDTRVNVDVAVMDTGIDLHHPDLNVVGGVDCGAGKGYDDVNGHGTHVAGTIGALDNGIGVVGVAPGVRLWSVRVFNKSAFSATSKVICGIDWITAHSNVIHLVNYSGGGKGLDDGACGSTGNGPTSSGPLHAAICDSVAHGITYVVSAGNNASDASTVIPAAFNEVITVSAFADYDGVPGGLANPPCFGQWPYRSVPPVPDDNFATVFSNFGPDVDLTAPGVCVLSTWLGGGYQLDTGTSMAAPHVTGGAALYLANHPGASPAQVQQALLANANTGSVANDPDVPPTPVVNVAGS